MALNSRCAARRRRHPRAAARLLRDVGVGQQSPLGLRPTRHR